MKPSAKAAQQIQRNPKIWLVWSNEHNAWWRPDACGYTTVEANAGRYTWEEACRHANKRTRGQDNLPDELVVPSPEAVLMIQDHVSGISDSLRPYRELLEFAIRELEKHPDYGPECHVCQWLMDAKREIALINKEGGA